MQQYGIGRRCVLRGVVLYWRDSGQRIAERISMDIGFIGLGEMGSAMASNALKAGHSVRVWNRSRDKTRALADQGASVVDTPEQAFAGDAAFSMLADDNALRSVLIDGGLVKHAPKGLVHVNMATISAALAVELAELHAQHGVAYVAAPVLGRPDVAAAGKLNILAAGADADIDRVQPVLDALGQKTWRVGQAPQHANVLKLAANFMLASAIETVGEAAALVTGHGIEAQAFLDVITNSLFPGPVYAGYGKMIAERRYEPALFKARLGLKDVRLAIAAGDAVNVPLPVASVVRDNLVDALAHGDGEKDFAVLGQVAARRAGR
ncbi:MULTISPECIES: NAD(P)-dependent oxidoreductase [unclassified Caballeronia]|uniref:NAD(P)-dependent oxidoreductase n=1 Tax=unclassified Caballeronia TaxID=2646786 RepID=UPI002856DC42|nr:MULTISPECIES: NAD(P)-dependent oxidoreductase [unclassified Caballeronia]MDR5737255.1 NAD(P)-dependent oxidoreductase [Caballeronia sp. LZ016]MDR5810214.1 NAD(P)-dependent oxidoreductase [Caballeronia sp. LZ019]